MCRQERQERAQALPNRTRTCSVACKSQASAKRCLHLRTSQAPLQHAAMRGVQRCPSNTSTLAPLSMSIWAVGAALLSAACDGNVQRCKPAGAPHRPVQTLGEPKL